MCDCGCLPEPVHEQAVYEQPVYEQPVYVPAPVDAAPVPESAPYVAAVPVPLGPDAGLTSEQQLVAHADDLGTEGLNDPYTGLEYLVAHPGPATSGSVPPGAMMGGYAQFGDVVDKVSGTNGLGIAPGSAGYSEPNALGTSEKDFISGT